MPELSRFQGMVVKLLFNDIEQHNKPHIHVYCAEHSASVALDGELLAGSLPVKKLTLLQAWIYLHEEELYTAWNKAVKSEPFGKIEPLR